MSPRRRRGILLPSVLAVMVIIGVAASAAVYMSRVEGTAIAGTVLQAALASAADEADALARSAFASRAPRMRVAETLAEPIPGSDTRVRATARITRLGAATFALTIAARAEDPAGRAAREERSLLLHLRPAQVDFPAALVVAGDAEVPPGVADGGDREPPGWECDGDTIAVPDVLHPLRPPPDSQEMRGLRDRASVRLAPGAAAGMPGPVTRDGECDTSDASNWGDPGRSTVCGSWLPIVHASGDLTISGGSGQGVLVVDGDLEISGGFAFTGAVVVAGDIAIGPGGGLLVGGVRAGGVVDAGGGPAANPAIVRSSCALRTALRAAGTLAPVADRAWAVER